MTDDETTTDDELEPDWPEPAAEPEHEPAEPWATDPDEEGADKP